MDAVDAVGRCGSEVERSRGRKLQRVGGTHTAHLGLAVPALARRLGPVCLKSLRKGQIKGRARGHKAAHKRSEASMHMHIYVPKHKETQSALTSSASVIDCVLHLSSFSPVSGFAQ